VVKDQLARQKVIGEEATTKGEDSRSSSAISKVGEGQDSGTEVDTGEAGTEKIKWGTDKNSQYRTLNLKVKTWRNRSQGKRGGVRLIEAVKVQGKMAHKSLWTLSRRFSMGGRKEKGGGASRDL